MVAISKLARGLRTSAKKIQDVKAKIKALESKKSNEKIDTSTIGKLKKELQNAMPADKGKQLRAKLDKLLEAEKKKKDIKKKPSQAKTNRMFSNETGSGRGKFQRGNAPAPKMFEGMAKGTKGGDAKAEAAVEAGLMGKVTMTPDANFIQAMATKSTMKAAKNRVALQDLAKKGDKKAQAIVDRIEAAESKAVDKKNRGISQSLRDRKIYEKGTYLNRETGELIKDPKRASDFPDGGPSAYDFNPTQNRIDAVKRSIQAKEKSPADRARAASTDDKRSSKNIDGRIKTSREPKETTNVSGRGGSRFNKGGMAVKKRMGASDYRKSGCVMSTVDNRKNKRK